MNKVSPTANPRTKRCLNIKRNMTLGIDIGISATKIIALDNEIPLYPELWKGFSAEQLSGYLGRHGIDASTISRISATGVGSRQLSSSVMGIPVHVIDEFSANAQSARWACDETHFIVISIGTGTSFVLIDGETSRHLGGCALGGGSLDGLRRMLFPGSDFSQFEALARAGSLAAVDLCIGDISDQALPNLPLQTTAANLAKANDTTTQADVAAGIENLVLQNIGVMAHLAGAGFDIKKFLIIGRTATLPHAREIFSRLESLYGISFRIPDLPEFMTALGAAKFRIESRGDNRELKLCLKD